MLSWQKRKWHIIIHAVGRAFVKAVCTPSLSQETQASKTNEEVVEELMKRVAANDAFSICMLADSYYYGLIGFQQDRAKAIERYTRAADLGCIKAHDQLGGIYDEGGGYEEGQVPLLLFL